MHRLSSLVAAAMLLPVVAAAADEAPSGVLTLSASASVEVAHDWLSVTLSTTREGADAATVQSALKQALDAALAEAKRAATPGQIEVQTGNFSLYPGHAPRGGWQGSAELMIEGRDMHAIAQLTGRINTLTIARVGYSLSREQREKVEADVAAQAIARYRAKAAEYAKQFGYARCDARSQRLVERPAGLRAGGDGAREDDAGRRRSAAGGAGQGVGDGHRQRLGADAEVNHPRSAFGASPSRGRRQRTSKAGSAAAEAWFAIR